MRAWAARAIARATKSNAGVSRKSSGQFMHEPFLGQPPIAMNRFGGDVQDLGGLVHAEAAKEPQLDHAGLARIDARQLLERLVEIQQIDAGRVRHEDRFIEGQVLGAAAAFETSARARDIDQDPAHDGGAHREKVRPILPVHLARAEQAQIHFVDERGGLERVVRRFPRHVQVRGPMQVLVDQRHEGVERALISSRPRAQQASNILRGLLGHAFKLYQFPIFPSFFSKRAAALSAKDLLCFWHQSQRDRKRRSRSFAPSGLRACPERSEGMTSASLSCWGIGGKEGKDGPTLLSFFVFEAAGVVILSGARDSARSEGPALLLAPKPKGQEKKKQVLRPFGAQDDKRVALVLGDWRERREGRPHPSLLFCFRGSRRCHSERSARQRAERRTCFGGARGAKDLLFTVDIRYWPFDICFQLRVASSAG